MINHLDTKDNPYVHYSSASTSPNGKSDKMSEVLDRCGKRFADCSKMVEAAADGIWNHLKLSSSVTDAAMARLHQGTKLVTEGGYKKVFQQTFGFVDGDKYLDFFACYLSTSSGPVNGTLYISTKRVAFCSEFPLCYYPSPGEPQWILYKVMIAVDQLGKINASSNLMDPSQKYIQVITRDSHEFWFMGFISYNKAVKTLTDALQRSRA
ncbi:GEM-like protein 2 isoform X1 [Benincasa hispida]|uniref:GEM-like protein 2 isoform X1 n=1 Tax=Benincasa hispida TaxID=102211 RepID=UPI001902321B|nr:GEM-like protein 2 isoform X1 [Benincasa hispida]XP_038887654.1 GEM-like protein 2 isoform X1 [Benincasa hispida]